MGLLGLRQPQLGKMGEKVFGCRRRADDETGGREGVARMAVIFITGGNSGLGYETARQMKAKEHTVVIGARSVERGSEAAARLGVDWVLMDVTSDESVEAGVREVAERYGRIDVLVNNAGVSAPRMPVEEITAADMQRVFDVNVFGVVRVTQAALGLLKAADHPAVVNVSSGLGSFACVGDSARAESKIISPVYCSSKAALNMLTVQFAKAYPWLTVNAVDPRSTKTNLNGGFGMQEVGDGVVPIVRAICAALDGSAGTGAFFDRDGELGW